MDFIIELILIIIFAILGAILEFIAYKIKPKFKLSSFEKSYNDSISEAQENKFQMTLHPEIKALYLYKTTLMLILTFIEFAFSIFVTILVIRINYQRIIVIPICIAVQILCLSLILISVNTLTKKIFFEDGTIIIKSALTKKIIEITNIENITEIHKRQVYLEHIEEIKIMRIFCKGKKYKISEAFSNYDKAKSYLSKSKTIYPVFTDKA